MLSFVQIQMSAAMFGLTEREKSFGLLLRPKLFSLHVYVTRYLSRHHSRIFQHLFESLEELGARGSVDDAVVARHRDVHHAANDDLPVADDGRLGGTADGEDACLGRIDDRGELLDAEHSEV